MTTLPTEPEGAPEAGTGGYDRGQVSHLQRQVAEGFGADAGRYDRARPTYPAGLVDRIIAASPGRDVLDVGCGTGIAARLFQAAGCRVLGVDPDPRMAELARQAGTATKVAKFEDWEPAGRMFDAVIAAQAWHWVDPVAGAAKAAVVLCPGGRLAVFWNAFDPPSDLREAFAEVFRRALPDSPSGGFWDRPADDAYRAGCARVADAVRQAGAFGEPEEWLSSWERPYTRDEWLDLVPTTGGFTRHPEAIQQELLDGLGAAVDAAGGTFTMSYTTIAATAARLLQGLNREALAHVAQHELVGVTGPAEVERPAAGSWQVDVGRPGSVPQRNGGRARAARERSPDDERPRAVHQTPGHPEDLVAHVRERWRVQGVLRAPEDGHDVARGARHMRHCHIRRREPGPRPSRQRRYQRLPDAPVRSGAQA